MFDPSSSVETLLCTVCMCVCACIVYRFALWSILRESPPRLCLKRRSDTVYLNIDCKLCSFTTGSREGDDRGRRKKKDCLTCVAEPFQARPDLL